MKETCQCEAVKTWAMKDLSSYFTHRKTMPLSSINMDTGIKNDTKLQKNTFYTKKK
jgi:hypothetical protein